MSEGRQIVSNTGPLISLEKMNRGYDFIRRLYTTLIIPPAVLAEVAADQFEVPQAYLEYYEIVDLWASHDPSDVKTSPRGRGHLI